MTLNPSPSLTERQLREILYDHLVTRRMPEVDHDELSDEAQDALVEYYKLCSGVTLGIGRIDPRPAYGRRCHQLLRKDATETKE